MFVWDRAGAIRRYEVVVQRDLARLNEQMKTAVPRRERSRPRATASASCSPAPSRARTSTDKAINVAAGYVDKKEDVVNLLQMQGAASNQVLLRVRFAEVSRSAMTELGVDLFTSPTGIKNTLGRVTTQQFPAPGFDDLKWTKANSDSAAT